MNRARITKGFWRERQNVNAGRAIFHQWEQLEASGCIQNFRIAAGEAEGFREGWFFADSDAYKWLEAAARIHGATPDPRLGALVDAFIGLLGRAQSPDGYLFTYNQIHFPGTRWINLQIEHELYCHGHLIEAGISHYEATGRTDLLEIARKAADRVVEDFRGKGPEYTPGHEEIEIALLRLHEVMENDTTYLEMARQFIERRGRMPLFALSILRQNASVEERGKYVKQKRQQYLAAHPEYRPFELPPGNVSRKPGNTTLRWYASALSGKYFQQHAPVRGQRVPVGHAVRFGYLETAVARLCRETGDATLLPALEQAWDRMVTRRMYVTGGTGSLAGLEGFGNDYELDPEYAYAETCAALAGMFWNWEMAQLTGKPRYSDLFEWQLYNAAAAGMGLEGTSYLYNNPLACRGGVTRRPWYAVPCCPSNLSRTWADLGRYIFAESRSGIWVQQYISSEWSTERLKVEMKSALPWSGKVRIRIEPEEPQEFTLYLRLPSWSPGGVKVEVNRESVEGRVYGPDYDFTAAAQGYDPRLSRMLVIPREWNAGDEVRLDLHMPISPRIKDVDVLGSGHAAVTRGPLVYCLESGDNPEVDLFSVRLDIASLKPAFDKKLLGGIMKLMGRSAEGKPLTFIPYFLWGNRGPSQMTVWVNTSAP